MNNKLLILILTLNVLSIYAKDYIISIIDYSVGVETKERGVNIYTSFFLSEEFEEAKGSNFPIKSLDVYLEGDNVSSQTTLGSFNSDNLVFNSTSNQYTINYQIPEKTKSGTYYLSFIGKAFDDNKIVGTSQNFNVGEGVFENKIKILSPPENAIWLTKSENHTIVFTVPNTAGKANKFSIKLKKVDDNEERFFPVLDSNNLENESEPSIALLDEEGILCHVKNAKYLVWSPIPNVPTGRYQLELYGYKDSELISEKNSKGSANSGESEIFSLVRSEDWGGVVKNHSNKLFNFSIINIFSIVIICYFINNL